MATTKKKTATEKIIHVALTDLYERADHPIKMREDDTMLETIESVKQRGAVFLPAGKAFGTGEKISGHYRLSDTGE